MARYDYMTLQKACTQIRNGKLNAGIKAFEKELAKVPKCYWSKFFFPAPLDGETVQVKGFRFDEGRRLVCGITDILDLQDKEKNARKEMHLIAQRPFALAVCENILGTIRLSEYKRAAAKQENKKLKKVKE